MDDLISRRAAIEGKICIQRSNGVEIYDDYAVPVEYLEQLPPAQLGANLAEVGTKIEPLTDKEQRIFLAAIERERKVCKEVDDQYTHEPYEILLTKVCNEIERKVKKALWS